MDLETRWHLAPTQEDWLRQAMDYIRQAEDQALARHGAFHIVLAGGNTPRRLYAALAQEPHAWARWHVWLGDERCLPVDSPQRNSRMVTLSLLAGNAIPSAQVHAIPAERGPEAAAEAYAQTLATVGDFDLVLLGLGEDGHTASLFPGQDWGTATTAADVLPVRDAPKPPPARVSLSARRLSRAHQVLFLVAGADKQRALRAWQAREPLPARAIAPTRGVDVLLSPETQPGAYT
ncbi:MAG TPA: 6-phosphogluconolactonase [Thiobacillaceae bacterium]|nr:6-phosphogluconolactonase [Thiobacillaceae bacterium]HNU64689.1 6-phosphogluconolactonase [Thiobacillaceae bacterium]